MNKLDLVPLHILIDRVVEPARRHAKVTVLPVALPVMAVPLAMVLTQAAWFDVMFTTDPEAMASVAGGGCAFILLTYLVRSLTFAALTTAAVDAVAGRPVSMGRAWAFVLRPRVLFMLLLVGMASFGSFMMCFLPLVRAAPRCGSR